MLQGKETDHGPDGRQSGREQGLAPPRRSGKAQRGPAAPTARHLRVARSAPLRPRRALRPSPALHTGAGSPREGLGGEERPGRAGPRRGRAPPLRLPRLRQPCSAGVRGGAAQVRARTSGPRSSEAPGTGAPPHTHTLSQSQAHGHSLTRRRNHPGGGGSATSGHLPAQGKPPEEPDEDPTLPAHSLTPLTWPWPLAPEEMERAAATAVVSDRVPQRR
ncbi:uncharacterized protein LOC144297525 [Canis aureus]